MALGLPHDPTIPNVPSLSTPEVQSFPDMAQFQLSADGHSSPKCELGETLLGGYTEQKLGPAQGGYEDHRKTIGKPWENHRKMIVPPISPTKSSTLTFETNHFFESHVMVS